MQTEQKPTRSGRPQLLLIAVVFLGPLVVAAWMYYGGHIQPQGKSNAGALLEPILNIPDELPDSQLVSIAPDQWVMLYADPADCGKDCRKTLYRMRQSRKMLGKEMDRIARVFLHGESPPDTVFLEEHHAGLITLSEQGLQLLLERKKPANLPPGGLYLIDPLGNLVMYFPPDLDPKKMVGDIKHLLKLSRIG